MTKAPLECLLGKAAGQNVFRSGQKSLSNSSDLLKSALIEILGEQRGKQSLEEEEKSNYRWEAALGTGANDLLWAWRICNWAVSLL